MVMTRRLSYFSFRISLNFEGMLIRPFASMLNSNLPRNRPPHPLRIWDPMPPHTTFSHFAIQIY